MVEIRGFNQGLVETPQRIAAVPCGGRVQENASGVLMLGLWRRGLAARSAGLDLFQVEGVQIEVEGVQLQVEGWMGLARRHMIFRKEGLSLWIQTELWREYLGRGVGGRILILAVGAALLQQLVHCEVQEAGNALNVLQVLAQELHGGDRCRCWQICGRGGR